jgi:hypothetical protein
MNHQPAHTYPNSYPDTRIDQVLDALRTAAPPTGLEQRIAARLAQAAEARTQSAPASASYTTVILNAVKDPCSSLAPTKFYSAAALTVVIALITLVTVQHRTHATTAQTIPAAHPESRVPHLRDGLIVAKVGSPTDVLSPAKGNVDIARSTIGAPILEGAGLQSRHQTLSATTALAAEGIFTPATTQLTRGISLGSHTLPQPAPVPLPPSAQDPETIALAETLAPSRPAPPMPLTAQEKLIQAATRPGQPIQLAELDLARAPVLRAAARARETATIDRYVKSLLAPFAVADALQPTTISQPQEARTSAPAPPTSNPSN